MPDPAPSDHDLHLLISDLLGFTDLTHHDSVPGFIMGTDPADGKFKSVPDWLGSLDACHRMEEALDTPERRRDYYLALCGPGDLMSVNWSVVHAPARKRCEAFVAVMLKGKSE
ncbi:MAG: hypothetical protein EOM65_14760 [Synergistales bacterium]|nr:hypothetical protein [Synergistales bacterium]